MLQVKVKTLWWNQRSHSSHWADVTVCARAAQRARVCGCMCLLLLERSYLVVSDGHFKQNNRVTWSPERAETSKQTSRIIVARRTIRFATYWAMAGHLSRVMWSGCQRTQTIDESRTHTHKHKHTSIKYTVFAICLCLMVQGRQASSWISKRKLSHLDSVMSWS